MSSNGFYNGNKSFIYYDNHWLCAWCIAHRYRVLLPNWKIIWRTTLARSNRRITFSSCALDFLPSCFLFLFYPIFFISHTTQLISSHLLSLGDLSAPYRSAPVPCWFFSLIFSSSPQTSPSPSSCTLFVLYPLCFCHVCFFFLPHYFLHSYYFLPPPPNVPTCVTPSRSFPSVLWKLSPLWGCLAEDRSPSAPAVPLKVT